MNKRIALAASVLIAVVAGSWQTHAGAAVKKPVALQYDEIVRIALPPSTPAPPGAFQSDYAAIVQTQTAAAATPSPAPPRRRGGIFGAIAQVVSGDVGGSEAASGGYEDAMHRMDAMRLGRLTRLTYYKNWVRTDDPVAQIATISKCDVHQFITLDLARKTYAIADTAPKCAPQTMPGRPGSGGTVIENEAPGTGDMTFASTQTDLGPKTLDGIPTTGADRAIEFSATNSTGSCRNSDAKIATEVYVSQIGKPRPYCPLPNVAPVPTSPENYVVHGGCKPRMHGSAAGMAAIFDSTKLEMYLKMTMASGGDGRPGEGLATVTERGNVKWLPQTEADALFSVPPGFAKQP